MLPSKNALTLCAETMKCHTMSQIVNPDEILFDTILNTRALLNAQHPIGGFGKAVGEFPGTSSPLTRLYLTSTQTYM